jgi:plastocyanin
MRRLLVLTVVSAALTFPAAASAADPMLTGTVGPGFTITLRTQAGAAVQHLDPGTYEIRISDQSEAHSFHLLGPGVDTATTPAEVGDVTWLLTLKDGTYSFFCDVHSTTMLGTFTVGNAAATPPPPPPVKPPTGGATRLTGTVGPAFTISLKRGTAAVRKLTAGRYAITVRDLASGHNFHLSGPGVNKRTTVPFTGTVTWRVALRRGTYRFVCDAHPTVMRGSFSVT